MAQQSLEDTLAQAKEMGLELNADGSAWIPISKSDVDDAHKSEKRKWQLSRGRFIHTKLLNRRLLSVSQ